MNVTLNDKPLDINTFNGATLGELLHWLQNHMNGAQVLASLTVDGQSLTGEMLSGLSERSVEEFSEVAVVAPDRNVYIPQWVT